MNIDNFGYYYWNSSYDSGVWIPTGAYDASGDYNSYYYVAGGNTEAVCLYPYNANLTYNILGAGGDNIGQVKVANGSVSGRY